jgi:hypothetical protein
MKPQIVIGIIGMLPVGLSTHAPDQRLSLASQSNVIHNTPEARSLAHHAHGTRSPREAANVVERLESRLGNIEVVATVSFRVDRIRRMCAEQQIETANRWRPARRVIPTDSRAQRLLSSVVQRTIISDGERDTSRR